MFGQYGFCGDHTEGLTGQTIAQLQQGIFVGAVAISCYSNGAGILTVQSGQLLQCKSWNSAAENRYGDNDDIISSESILCQSR